MADPQDQHAEVATREEIAQVCLVLGERRGSRGEAGVQVRERIPMGHHLTRRLAVFRFRPSQQSGLERDSESSRRAPQSVTVSARPHA
jgi:hypothetical protein